MDDAPQDDDPPDMAPETAPQDSAGAVESVRVATDTADGDDVSLTGIILGAMILLAGVGYVGVYVMQAANVARYHEGFVLSVCPVCEDGRLWVEDRRYRTLGIPRVRRTVRCDACRSVLRQVGPHEWRYAVDGAENEHLFRLYNGRVLSESDLLAVSPEFRDAPIEFIEDDSADY